MRASNTTCVYALGGGGGAHLQVGEPVCDDVGALIDPECQHAADGGTLSMCHVQHTLPDAGQVAQVEDVVELGWRQEHLSLPARGGEEECFSTWSCHVDQARRSRGMRDVSSPFLFERYSKLAIQ